MSGVWIWVAEYSEGDGDASGRLAFDSEADAKLWVEKVAVLPGDWEIVETDTGPIYQDKYDYTDEFARVYPVRISDPAKLIQSDRTENPLEEMYSRTSEGGGE